jgi:hypothetical protein
VSGGSVANNIQDDFGLYFTLKDLRQGDPPSPMIFNIVDDMIPIMIKHAKINGLIEGVVPHLLDGVLSILQYADNTILFMKHDFEKARYIKLILSSFSNNQV